MNRASAVLVGVAALSLAACSEPKAPAAGAGAKAVARLWLAEGDVQLTRGSEPPKPALLGPLYARDTVITGAKSRAVLKSASKELELGEFTHFQLGETLDAVEIGAGVIKFLSDDAQTETRLLTRFGQTTLSPGAHATVTIRENGLWVDVAMGTITQVLEDGGTASATKGQRFELEVCKIPVVDLAEVEAPAPAKLDAQLVPEGRVQVKKPGEPKFADAAQGPQPLVEGSAFQVGNTARAQVAVPGVSVRLPAAAAGTLDGASHERAGNTLTLAMTSMAFAAAFDGTVPGAVSLTGKTPFLLHSTLEATALVTRDKQGPKVAVLAGEVEVTAGGKIQTVKAGESGAVNAEGVTVTALPRPVLMLPEGRRTRVYGWLPEVGLAVGEHPARVQVASDADFAQVLVAGRGEDFVRVQPPRSGELFWRSYDGEGKVASTGRTRFSPEASVQRDAAPRTDQVAETGLSATVLFQTVVPTLTFTFPASEGAQGYRFRVYSAANMKQALVDRKATENRYTVESGKLSEGSYIWSATPLGANGVERKGGRANKMDIVFDNPLVGLSITAPKQGQRAAPGTVASGVAPRGAKLYVNGKGVPTDARGRFSTTVGRSEWVVFRLAQANGVESYWLRQLKR